MEGLTVQRFTSTFFAKNAASTDRCVLDELFAKRALIFLTCKSMMGLGVSKAAWCILACTEGR